MQLFSTLLSLNLCGPGDRGHSINKLGSEENVGVVEHSVLERDHDELAVLEVVFQHLADVLSV